MLVCQGLTWSNMTAVTPAAVPQQYGRSFFRSGTKRISPPCCSGIVEHLLYLLMCSDCRMRAWLLRYPILRMSLLRCGNSGIPLFFARAGPQMAKVKKLLLFAAGCGCRCLPYEKFTPRRRMHSRCNLLPGLLHVAGAPINVVFGSSIFGRWLCPVSLLLRCRHSPPAAELW